MSPTQWVVWGEEEQGSAAKFLPQAETEQSGLCDDEGAALCAVQAFCPKDKTLAEGRLCRPEHLKNLGVPIVCHGTQWAAGRHR